MDWEEQGGARKIEAPKGKCQEEDGVFLLLSSFGEKHSRISPSFWRTITMVIATPKMIFSQSFIMTHPCQPFTWKMLTIHPQSHNSSTAPLLHFYTALLLHCFTTASPPPIHQLNRFQLSSYPTRLSNSALQTRSTLQSTQLSTLHAALHTTLHAALHD